MRFSKSRLKLHRLGKFASGIIQFPTKPKQRPQRVVKPPHLRRQRDRPADQRLRVRIITTRVANPPQNVQRFRLLA